MSKFYTYDVESFDNLFMISFLPVQSSELKKEYIKTDIDYLNCSVEDRRELMRKKIDLYEQLGGRMFIIFNDLKGDKSMNHAIQLHTWLSEHKILYGYNSFNYDSLMLDTFMYYFRHFDANGWNKSTPNLHFTQFLFQQGQKYIQLGHNYFKEDPKLKRFRRTYEDRDLQKILYLDKKFVSLKQVAINLKWHRIQELPLGVFSKVAYEDVVTVMDYNINDNLMTDALLIKSIEEIDLRADISEMYEMDFSNDSRSSIGNKLMIHFYALYSGLYSNQFRYKNTERYKVWLDDVIDKKINFKTEKFKNLLNYIKSKVIYVGTESKENFQPIRIEGDYQIFEPVGMKDDEFQAIELLHGQTKYTIAKGGLHSKDENVILLPSIHEILRDADVTSYYPFIIILFQIAPEHLIKPIFLKIIHDLTNDRVEAKKSGNKIKAEALKIVINRIYGALNNKHDMLRDPSALYSTTFNGQLSLLMLIERLEQANISVVSANTDGIVSRFDKTKEEIYNQICSEWMQEIGFNLEFTDYEKYIRKDVNNYIAIKKGFKDSIKQIQDEKEKPKIENKYLKYKGEFNPEIDISKGYDAPVLKLALNNYFIYDIPIKETIENHINSSDEAIYDYCISQKTDNKFNNTFVQMVAGQEMILDIQKANRFYVCRKEEGGRMLKNTDKKSISITTKTVKIFNNFFYSDDYAIDYKYYMEQCDVFLYGKIKKNKKKKADLGIMDNSFNLFNNIFENET